MSVPRYPMVILAGGLGTRLGEAGGGVPKAIVDIEGEPFLHRVLRLVARAGIDRVVISIGIGGDQVRRTLGDGSDLDVSIHYVDDGPEPLGTAGALKESAQHLDGPFFVLNGDSYLPCDYGAVQAAFERADRPALMVVHRNAGRWDRSNVRFEHGRVVAYDKWSPSPDMEWIDYGLGVLHHDALADVPLGRPADLGRAFQRLIARGQLAGHEVTERFYEVGSASGLADFRRHIRDACHG